MIKEKYNELIKSLPKESFHKFTKEETGYQSDIISHNYQYAVNRMNEVIGPENWLIEEEIIESTIRNDLYEVVKKITVIIIDSEEKDSNKRFVAKKWHYGGGISKSLADAHKSAVTNGLKKALALFGVGKETYEQSIDDDFLEKIKVENKVSAPSVDEVKEINKKIMSSKTEEELRKTKSLIEKSKLEIKDKTILINLYNSKLQTLCAPKQTTKNPQTKPQS